MGDSFSPGFHPGLRSIVPSALAEALAGWFCFVGARVLTALVPAAFAGVARKGHSYRDRWSR